MPAREISLDSIRDAAANQAGVVTRTPLVRLDVSEPGGPRALYVKLETLQPIGSFKIRGAWNAVRQLGADALARGVWTVSAGNAAQGVALAARTAGAPCRVLVTDTAPESKRAAIARLGAAIVPVSYDECWEAVEAHGSPRMTGTFVHPFDDDRFIAGNGTIGLEILEDLPEVDAIVASIGGGGLVAGIAAAVRGSGHPARVFAAEPDTAAPLAYSIARGEPSRFPGWQASFVDGAGGRSVLSTMWPLLAPPRLADSLVVPLAAVRRAMRLLADRLHVIAEGAGACAVAAALSGRAGTGTVVAVVSGGNVDLERFADLVGACPDHH